MRFPIRKRSTPTIHLTALIDIVFLLLVFFLLTSNFVTQHGVSIQLPEVASKSKDLLPDIIVRVDHQGVFYFKGIAVTDDLLHNYIRNSLTVDKMAKVAIHADRRVAYDRVVDAIDIAKQAGAKDFLLVTHKKDD